MVDDQPGGKFENLGLAEWPFRLVPLAGPTGAWYSRAGLREDLDRLLWRLTRQNESTLNLLWADVGSGKTHTLRFLEHQAMVNGDILPVYAVMPKLSRSFVELYGAIARSFDLTKAANALLALRTSDGDQMASVVIGDWPDLLPALTLYGSGGPTDHEFVRRWLVADRGLSKADLRRVGIGQEIRTSDHAVAALTAMSRLYLTASQRVLILIDELQRIGTVRSAVANEISAGIHTWFNSVPEGLSLILTFAFGDKTHVDALLTRELLSRTDHQRLEMGALTATEAREFVAEAVAACRLADVETTALHDELIDIGVEAVGARGSLTPRNVMNAFNALLIEIDYRQQMGRPALASADARELLDAVRFDTDDDEG